MPKIKIILGSSRPTGFSEQPGVWLHEIGKTMESADFEIVDLTKVNLPFMDEPQPPMAGNYQNEHTKQWAKVIGEADGFVFVVAEYNHGYTPLLKNAIDFLYREWIHKPVAFLSYGAAAGGARAVEQLRGVVAQLSMYDLNEQVILPHYYLNMKEGQYQFTERHEQEARTMLANVIFWADKMKPAREELASR